MSARCASNRETPARWDDHALATLQAHGYRSSRPRRAIVEALATRHCGTTARELQGALERAGVRVGVASVYRTLELLADLGLVRRLELRDGGALFEPALPDGSHHHHLICEACGEVETFEDAALERAITALARRVRFQVAAHDVTLRGICPDCAARQGAEPAGSRGDRR